MFLAELDEAGNQAKTYTLGNEYAGHVSELNNSLTSENKAASYYITDEQGSIRYILDQSGEVLNFYQYSAFGETIISEETTPNRLRYNAQTEDELTGLYYLRARYYAPNIGRFTQEDVIYNDGLNLYAYCNSNPVMYSDPSGFAKETCKSKVGGECGSESGSGSDLDGIRIINKKYAGKTYELSGDLATKYPSGVKFSNEGFPDFEPYSIKKVTVDNLEGDAYYDFIKANEAARYPSTPTGYTWHHVEDGRTMLLVPSDLHGAVRHTGGASLIRKGIRP